MTVNLPYVPRALPVQKYLEKKSILLLGPRRTGKSALIRHEIQADRTYNLLDSIQFRELAFRPSLIRERLRPQDQLIVIDEIQKLPQLMDEVHLMIEEHQIRFLLTGSSARKLKKTFTSLMAGRAKKLLLFPFSARELGKQFDLNRYLQYGGLPSIYFSENPWDELNSYVGDYLKEEILAEALTRRIDSYSRFLEAAAFLHAQLLNYEAIASDAQVPARTIREYYHLLEDTLMGITLQPLASLKKTKSFSKGKFYFFDLGVLNFLLGRKSISPKTPEYGFLFETWVLHEIRCYLETQQLSLPIQFWRAVSGQEVDFIIGDSIAIQVKATSLAHEKQGEGLYALSKLIPLKKQYLISQDSLPRRLGPVEILPFPLFIEKLWSGELFSSV